MAVRPTTALVRQALFNILGGRIRDALVVDLFAGAGTVGFEALSRGAGRVVAVEKDRAMAASIEATARRLGCSRRVRVVPGDVLRWLDSRPRDLEVAELVFLDAPYRDDVVLEALERLTASPTRLLVCEHHRARELPVVLGRMHTTRTAMYGTTQLTFYAARPDAAVDVPAPGEEVPTA